jgi:acetylornithine deacetylase/succinyl-diaminopimelate desuccinylase-like protein
VNEQEWNAINEEALGHLRKLVQFDTSNPPGNEVGAANYIRDVLAAENIDAEVIESAPGRGNAFAIMPGDGSKQPLLVLSHIDVVPAEADKWSVPPFSAEVKDGYIWGRGTLDTKSLTVMEMMALILAKRGDLALKRDIKFAALADEECGGEFGAQWAAENHFDKISAEYALNEGGLGMRSDKGLIYMLATAEKGVCWSVLTARGRPGHASMPHDDNAVVKMADAAGRLSRHRSPVRITKTVSRFLTAASAYDRRVGILKLAAVPVLGGWVMRKMPDRLITAMFHNTFAPTVIQGGKKSNIIPDECTLKVDSRILPGVSKEDWLREMREILAGLPIDVEPEQFSEATESDVDAELYKVAAESIKEADPDAVVAPFMVPGATDSRFLRLKGIMCYGIMPLAVTKEEIDTIHGVDERLSLEAFERGLRITCEIVRKLCT